MANLTVWGVDVTGTDFFGKPKTSRYHFRSQRRAWEASKVYADCGNTVSTPQKITVYA